MPPGPALHGTRGGDPAQDVSFWHEAFCRNVNPFTKSVVLDREIYSCLVSTCPVFGRLCVEPMAGCPACNKEEGASAQDYS